MEEQLIIFVTILVAWVTPCVIAIFRGLSTGQVAITLGASILFFPLGYLAAFTQVDKNKAEAIRKENERLQKLAEDKAKQLQRIDEYNNMQASSRKQLELLSSISQTALNSIPETIKSANIALDKADAEFTEGVFAPFWDAVESALLNLTRYDELVRSIADNTTRFAEISKSFDSQPPSYIPESSTIPDATTTVERLRTLVRRAQKIPDFAKIYEMRRTNTILVAGFTNLGNAIENMGSRIQDSISILTNTLDGAISSMSRQNAEYYRESLSAIEGMREQLLNTSEQLSSDSKSQREHDTKVEEMLDNIQRRKRPYVEHFRDGQY